MADVVLSFVLIYQYHYLVSYQRSYEYDKTVQYDKTAQRGCAGERVRFLAAVFLDLISIAILISNKHISVAFTAWVALRFTSLPTRFFALGAVRLRMGGYRMRTAWR